MEALRKYLQDNRLTQADLARLCGTKQPVIANVINGKRLPSVDLLKRLCRVTGVSADTLLFGEPSVPPRKPPKRWSGQSTPSSP